MYNSIKTTEDIRYFLEKTNSLHDGDIIGVRYENNGISKIENGHFLEPDKTRLVLKILVTSIWDAIVELEFDSLFEWQIKDTQFEEMISASVTFDDHNRIVWADDAFLNIAELKKGSYVIASSMRWRFVE